MRKRLSLVLALVGALGAAGNALESRNCSVVWKPAPVPEGRGAELLPDDWAAATAALAGGLPLVAVVEALGSDEARLLLRRRKALPGDGEPDEAEQGGVLCAVLVRQDRDTGRWKFLLGNGREFVLEPDSTTWAFWDNPEGYDHDFFETHRLYNGYSAVWVGSCHRVSYTPASAAAPIVAAVPSRRSGSGSGTATATAVAAPAAAVAAPLVASAFTPSFSLSCPLPPMPVLALAAETESARAIPEPATAALSLLALAALLARRRRVSPVSNRQS